MWLAISQMMMPFNSMSSLDFDRALVRPLNGRGIKNTVRTSRLRYRALHARKPKPTARLDGCRGEYSTVSARNADKVNTPSRLTNQGDGRCRRDGTEGNT